MSALQPFADDHHSFRVSGERSLVEITPQMLDLKSGIAEATNLLECPGPQNGRRFHDGRPFGMAIGHVPNRVRAPGHPRLLDGEELRPMAENLPCRYERRFSGRTVQAFENNSSVRRQMTGNPFDDFRARVNRRDVSHGIIRQHHQIEWGSKGEFPEIGGDEVSFRRFLRRPKEQLDEKIDRSNPRVTGQNHGHSAGAAAQLENALRAPSARDRLPEWEIAALFERGVVVRKNPAVEGAKPFHVRHRAGSMQPSAPPG